MDYHDIDTGDSYHRTLRIGYYADPVFALSYFSGGQTDTEVYQVFGESVTGGNFRYAGGVLFKKCILIYGESRTSGIDFHCTGCGTSPMETEHAAFHRGRNGMLYAFGPVGVLIFYFLGGI